MKKGAGTLRAGLNAAAAGNKQQQLQPAGQSGTVLIGAHYQPEVRRALYLLQAEPRNAGKKLKSLQNLLQRIGWVISTLFSNNLKKKNLQNAVLSFLIKNAIIFSHNEVIHIKALMEGIVAY